MPRPYDKPITIEIIDETTEVYSPLYNLHARINKGKNDNEYLNAGAVQSRRTLVFEVRYFKALEDIRLNTQLYRVMYNGVPYDIEDYDDYQEEHKSIKLLGVSY